MHLFVKFEPIFCKKSEPIRILYPFHSPFTTTKKGLLMAGSHKEVCFGCGVDML